MGATIPSHTYMHSWHGSKLSTGKLSLSLGKAAYNTYSKWVFVALVIKHAKHMHHIMLSPVASMAVLYFCTLSLKWHNFRKKKL
jgi:hypothetical protein